MKHTQTKKKKKWETKKKEAKKKRLGFDLVDAKRGGEVHDDEEKGSIISIISIMIGPPWSFMGRFPVGRCRH